MVNFNLTAVTSIVMNSMIFKTIRNCETQNLQNNTNYLVHSDCFNSEYQNMWGYECSEYDNLFYGIESKYYEETTTIDNHYVGVLSNSDCEKIKLAENVTISQITNPFSIIVGDVFSLSSIFYAILLLVNIFNLVTFALVLKTIIIKEHFDTILLIICSFGSWIFSTLWLIDPFGLNGVLSKHSDSIIRFSTLFENAVTISVMYSLCYVFTKKNTKNKVINVCLLLFGFVLHLGYTFSTISFRFRYIYDYDVYGGVVLLIYIAFYVFTFKDVESNSKDPESVYRFTLRRMTTDESSRSRKSKLRASVSAYRHEMSRKNVLMDDIITHNFDDVKKSFFRYIVSATTYYVLFLLSNFVPQYLKIGMRVLSFIVMISRTYYELSLAFSIHKYYTKDPSYTHDIVMKFWSKCFEECGSLFLFCG